SSSSLGGLALVFLSPSMLPMALFNSTDLSALLKKYMDEDEDREMKPRRKRAISSSDMQAILDLHNKLRAQVYPPASNMEYMVWDTELERTAEEWAETCLWEHGPAGLLPQIGQNLGVHWGRYRPPTSHVQAWYDEVKDYSFPYPQECNPHCPFTCTGPVCTHYTQLVWATSSRIGCAINVCYDMNVWGQIWAKAVYLVCNYSPKGNWWGHAPYKHGTPCSACPPSYGGGCRNNLCYKEHSHVETEENNSIEPEAPRSPKTPRWPDTEGDRNGQPLLVCFAAQLVSCDTKLRDQCKGTTCNRYECPAGCLESTAKVVGTVYYEMQSSICRAGIHHGVIDNEGGWMDVTRQGRKEFFIKSNKNGVQSLNFPVFFFFAVKVITCETTVAMLCPYKKPIMNSAYFLQKSSICRSAVHAGVIKNELGGYVDVMPTNNRKQYFSSYQNGIYSERAFRLYLKHTVSQGTV
uniref:LCCL domain-containing protein n=1 Tax=Pygocentrus nattereri TaxID=42514 RepID=A0A3B4CYK3_PYGNA